MNLDYTTLNTLISTIALLITLIGIYAFFKLSSLKDLMIGQGKAIISNFDEPAGNDKKEWDKLFDVRELRRLKDDVLRKNIYGIEKCIIQATTQDDQHRPGGLYKNILPNFIRTMRIYNCLTYISLITLFSLILSLIYFLLREIIGYKFIYTDLFFLIITGIAFVLFCLLIYIALFKKVGFESIKSKESKKLRKEHPGINKLYCKKIF